MPTINIIPARLRPRAFYEWGIFKSFVRFSILRTIPLLDSIGANNRPLPPKTFGHKNVADEQLKHKQCTESQQSLPDRKILHFQKKKNAPALLLGWMMLIIIKTKSKSKGFLLHLIGPFFWINCGSSRVLHVWYKATYIYSKPGYSPNF